MWDSGPSSRSRSTKSVETESVLDAATVRTRLGIQGSSPSTLKSDALHPLSLTPVGAFIEGQIRWLAGMFQMSAMGFVTPFWLRLRGRLPRKRQIGKT